MQQQDQNILLFNPQFQNGFELIEVKQMQQNKNYEFQLCRPINIEDGIIYDNMSREQKLYQNQQIKLYNHFVASLHESQKGVVDDEYELSEQEIQKIADFNQQFSDLTKKLETYPQEIEIILRDQLSQHFFECQEIKDESQTFCLLYSQQSQQQLDHQLNMFSELAVTTKNIVILVNGWDNLHEELQNVFLKKEISSSLRYNTCSYFSYKNNSDNNDYLFLILNQKQSESNLLKWIYNGIAKHFQSQYFFVGSLDLQIENSQFVKAYNILMKNKHFAILLHDEIQQIHSLEDFCGLQSSIIQQINYLNSEFVIDSLTNIKKFHQPFLCYYNWNLIRNHVDLYLKQLEIEFSKEKINLSLNSILPQLMYEKTKMISHSLASPIGLKQLKAKDLIGLKQFDILQQKQHCFVQCNKAALKQGFILKKGLYFIKFIDKNYKLAIILFIFIITPYQLFYQNTEYPIIQVLISIIVPLILIINIFFYILLPQQYQVGLRYIIKSSETMIAQIKSKRFLQIYFSTDQDVISVSQNDLLNKNIKGKNNENIQYSLTNLHKLLREQNINLQDLNIEVNGQFDNQNIINNTNVRNESESMNEKQNLNESGNDTSEEYWNLSCQMFEARPISTTYITIFQITQFITLSCTLFVFVNIILTFILNLSEQTYTQVNLYGLLGLIFLYIIRNISKFNSKCSLKQLSLFILTIFLQFFANILVTCVYSEIYHFLVVSKSYHSYRKDIRKLMGFVYSNFILLLGLVIIETQTGLQGYVYLPIIYYYIATYIIDSILVIIAKLLQTNNQLVAIVHPNNQSQNQNDRKEEETKLLPFYQEIVLDYMQHLKEEKNKIEQDEIKQQVINYEEMAKKHDLQDHLMEESDNELPDIEKIMQKEIFLGFD